MMPWCNLTCRTTCSHITKSMRCSLCDCVLMYVCVHPTGAMSSGLRLEDSPFYDFLSPGPSPLSPPGQSMGSVGDGWPPRANSPPPHGNTVTWPPGTLAFICTDKESKMFALKIANSCVCVCAEFRPGEPWKGYPNIDPETDPYVTPGSVINNLSINTVRDTDHLRDRNNGRSHMAGHKQRVYSQFHFASVGNLFSNLRFSF